MQVRVIPMLRKRERTDNVIHGNECVIARTGVHA
jgi:hypothetical protein